MRARSRSPVISKEGQRCEKSGGEIVAKAERTEKKRERGREYSLSRLNKHLRVKEEYSDCDDESDPASLVESG